MRKLISIFLILALSGISIFAAKLPSFTSDTLPKKSFMGKTVGVPYTSLVTYFGYIKPGSKPDAVINKKKIYFIYVWIPAVAPELGIRMISPASSITPALRPKKKDFVSPLWEEGQKDTESYFDTWVSLERATSIKKAADIKTKLSKTKWVRLGANDDSSELFAQPSGSKYNSVLRIVSQPSNPTKALTKGLYRIGFTTFKRGEVKGTFIAQVGAPIKLPGVIIEKDKKKLIELVK